MIQFERGMQVAYVPDHILETFKTRAITIMSIVKAASRFYKDREAVSRIEFGFVTSVVENGVFCRYWSPQYAGFLRTVSNSELTPPQNLFHYRFCDQKLVDAALKEIE